jgi:hypothetical protein
VTGLRAVASLPGTTPVQCPYCAEQLPPDVRKCPLCLSAVTADADADADADDVYEIPALEPEIQAEWQSAAVYTLEAAVRCPHCQEPIRSVRVLALTRTQVSFTSTLPRKGRVLACPECERILSVELSGF